MLMGIAALLPLMLIGIVPMLTGDLPRENFLPLVPLGHDAAGAPIDGAWDKAGWILFIGGLFIAAWSTYGFETAVCYTREFKDPKRDTSRRSSTPASCASPCSSSCRSPSRALSV